MSREAHVRFCEGLRVKIPRSTRLQSGRKMIYKFIKKYRSAFRVVKMCQVLKVSRGSYYNWLRRPTSRHQKDKILIEKMRRIHKESYKTYGIRRLKAKLNKESIFCGKNRIARLMRENGIFSRLRRKYKATTHSNHHLPIAPNLLDQDFTAVDPIKNGWVILPKYPPMKVSCISQVSKIHFREN